MFELTTAVVIVPPHEVQAVAVPIIRQFAPESLVPFRPHITLLFPFVPYAQIDAACATLRALGENIPPFPVTLDGYGQFPGVIYMKPANPESIRSVFRQLFSAFPDYPPYEGQFGNDLKPHLTVAHFDDQAGNAPVPVLDAYDPVTFTVSRLHVWYGVRRVDLPWLTYDVIPLRG